MFRLALNANSPCMKVKNKRN